MRCRLSRGFGVQSPSAYSFIRYVINEHYPYYAYADLKDRLDMFSLQQHKYGRLLFRLANFWQPEARYTDEVLYHPYMYAGCHKTNSYVLADLIDSDKKKMVVIDLDHLDVETLFNSILPLCNESTLLVLLNLHKHNKNSLWNRLKESEYTGITYNLYYLGILFFDLSKFKQHYQVNF